ncbi:MAG: hypothetical protein IPI84_14355 [Holophagaceae bacterium]|nr:hypothetical protein [Holophagaceae bacterium]
MHHRIRGLAPRWPVDQGAPGGASHRQKNRRGLPEQAIERLLQSQGLGWQDVDAYVFGGHGSYANTTSTTNEGANRMRGYKAVAGFGGQIKQLLQKAPARRLVHHQRRERHIERLLAHGVDRQKVFTIEHHRCYASTAYFGRPIDEDALVITVDGAGDSLCATVSCPSPEDGSSASPRSMKEHSIGNSGRSSRRSWAWFHGTRIQAHGHGAYASGDRVEKAKLFSSAFELSDGTWRRAPGVPNSTFAYGFGGIDWSSPASTTHLRASELHGVPHAWVQGWLQKTGRRKLPLRRCLRERQAEQDHR